MAVLRVCYWNPEGDDERIIGRNESNMWCNNDKNNKKDTRILDKINICTYNLYKNMS
jgi:hypothetical protein